MTAPCTWPVVYPQECASFVDDPDSQAMFEAMATAFLWNWTGRVYGSCPVVIRPCRSDCSGADSTYWGFGPYSPGSAMPASGRWGPALVGGQWINLACGRCGDLCSCGALDALRLPGPVSSVEEVRVDGTPLVPTAYRVDNHSLLVRLDGEPWPLCQDMGSPVDQPNTWQISYTYGTPVPEGGQIAAGMLACELAKGAVNDRSCLLPQRVQTIARQGITVTMLDTFEDVAKGRTGIWLVDSWVASVTQPPRGGSVRSVDIPNPRHRVTTWSAP